MLSHAEQKLSTIFLLIILALSFKASPLLAKDFPPESPNLKSLMQPADQEIFSPRIYGSETAPNKIMILMVPTGIIDAALFTALLPQIHPLINENRASLEIRLMGADQPDMPVFLLSQCIAPLWMGDFLYQLNLKGPDFYAKQQTDIDSVVTDFALANKSFYPSGLDENSFRSRLQYCLSRRNIGVKYTEKIRFDTIYQYNLREGGGVAYPVVVVNGKVFEKDNSSVEDIMGALK